MCEALTTRPGLQECAVRHNPCVSKCTRCWLANPRTPFERLQMALAKSRMLLFLSWQGRGSCLRLVKRQVSQPVELRYLSSQSLVKESRVLQKCPFAAKIRAIPVDKDEEREATQNRAALLVSWTPSTTIFEAAGTPSLENTRRENVKGSSRKCLEGRCFWRDGLLVWFCQGTDEGEDRQGVNFERDKSLNQTL